jgi:hypothetical protein
MITVIYLRYRQDKQSVSSRPPIFGESKICPYLDLMLLMDGYCTLLHVTPIQMKLFEYSLLLNVGVILMALNITAYIMILHESTN